jgi:2,3-bisphosphoglycerate-independent phosphoglycerate mutase
MQKKTPSVLLILDGFGYAADNNYNAITKAHTPNFNTWWQTYPHALLEASGRAVGLPDKQIGNSEVGHMHIGAGRVINQDLSKINLAISNKAFNKVIEHSSLLNTSGNLHVIGLFSQGGVHSHADHLFAFLDILKTHQAPKVYLHLILDGRDTSPKSSINDLKNLYNYLEKNQVAQISSICGRYYAMDRDSRWERLELFYQNLYQEEYKFTNAIDAVAHYYDNNLSDEFIPPTRVGTTATLQDHDTIFCFNFRADRMRQLAKAFTDRDFEHFPNNHTKLSHFISMSSYGDDIKSEVLFPKAHLQDTLGEIVANQKLSQLRIAETEKYAHVTYFFNGGSDILFTNEDRTLIPSPKVATYDLTPKMNAELLTATLIDKLRTYDFIVCNFANADMLGHCGDINTTIEAINCLDICMGKIWQSLAAIGGELIITADHGNAEQMFDSHTKQQHTAHTNNPVPFLYLGDKKWQITRAQGSLIDIAPTVLTIMGIEVPSVMEGRSLLCDNSSLI